VPTWSEAQRDSAGGIVANPIAVESTRRNAVPVTGDGLAPYFMALGLWVGAMAVFLVLPALPTWLGRRRWLGALSGFAVASAFAVAQAVLMVLALHVVVGVEVVRLPELVGLTALVGIAFVAVNQALVAAFGFRGLIVSLVLAVLQLTSAGIPYPIETAPGFFQALHPLLPMGYAVEAGRTLIAGGSGSIVPALIAIGVWLVAGLAVTLLVCWYRSTDRTFTELLPTA
jgi:putative membrane protein